MQRDPRQRSIAPGAIPSFEAKLENEEAILDAMLTALSRGQLPVDQWQKLHEAAQRDGRVSELAFSYESVAQGKRLKTLQPPVVAEFLFKAATFFGDVFGDEFGAVTYLERSLQALPTHAGAFDRLDAHLTKAGDFKRLAELYASGAPHRARPEQIVMLRRAAELFERAGVDDKASELYQQLLRIDPSDEIARNHLEARFLRANRHRDVARLLEQALGTDPPPAQEEQIKLRGRLIDLYAGQLHEPERSMPHVEALLAIDPAHEEARKVAMKLLAVKGLAARAAAVLADSFDATGNVAEVARYLSIELDNTRGPKRREVLRRIGALKQEFLNDPTGAYEAYEAALAIDPAEDELRARYCDLAVQLGRPVDAARTLARVGTAAKDGAIRARMTAEMGYLLLEGNDAKRARATFLNVLSLSNADEIALLRAGRALANMYEAEGDLKALAGVLERIAGIETDPDRKRTTNERLAELASTVLGDPARAINAWRELVDTASRDRALAALEPLYESAERWEDLAFVLAERAKDAKSPGEGRALAYRAAELLTTKTQDHARASAAWRQLVDKYGSGRDVHAHWIPLLEGQKDWPGLVDALEAESRLAPEHERAAILSRLGIVRMQRTKQMDEAIDAFKRALAADPAEKTSRATLEKLLAGGDHRLEAAEVLEPIYRGEANAPGLLRVLELKAQLSPIVGDRLDALAEAMRTAEGNPSTSNRALDLATKGLGEAIASDEPCETWIEAVDRLASGGVDPKRRASLLAKALGDRPITSAALLAVARRVGEAYAAISDIANALAVYRRALEFEPSSNELVSRIDELLQEQGSPRERVALYQAALDRGVIAQRRRELLHKIGYIERNEIKNAPGAIDAYRQALADDADDREAHEALVELYQETKDWERLCDVLEERIGHAPVEEARKLRAQLAEVAATHDQKPRAAIHAAGLLADAGTGPAELEVIERVASALDDVALATRVIERRISKAEDPREEVQWLEKLAALALDKKNDPASAVETLKRAAALALQLADDDLARALFTRVRSIAPDDVEATAQLATLLEKAGQWSELPALIELLLSKSELAEAKAASWMRLARVQGDKLGNSAKGIEAAENAFALTPEDPETLALLERLAIGGHAAARFSDAIDRALDGGRVPAYRRADLLIAKAHALASDSNEHERAAQAYRSILEGGELDDARERTVVLELEALLTASEQTPARIADRRWLCAWHVEHASDAEKVMALTAWAELEEKALGDPARALELFKRILGIDPENTEAMAATSRLALATGDVDGAVAALVGRRDRSEGVARNALDLEIATILVERTERLAEALACVASVLEVTPQDETALALASKLLGARATRRETVAVLEKTLDGVDDTEVKIGILQRILAVDGDAAATAEQRTQWYVRLLDLLEAQERFDDALATVVRAAADLPSNASLWERAEGLARRVKRPDDVAKLYQDVLRSTTSRDDALELGQRAVAFNEEWFEDAERVVGILERILEIDPTESWAFDRLKLIFDAAERWDDLFRLYDRAIAAAADGKKVELLEDAAQIAKDFANHSARAIGYLEQLLALKPGNARLTASLERLYERHGCHRELIELLTAQLGSLPLREAQETRARIATIWLDKLADAASALPVVEDMIVREPDASDTGKVDVSGLLERILAIAPPTAELRESSVPEMGSVERRRDSMSPMPVAKRVLVRQRVAALLKERYQGRGRDKDLVRVLEVELEAVKSVRERIRRHQQIAALYEKLGNDDAAMDHYVALVLLEPDVAKHREQLASLAGRIGRHDRLAEVLVTAADDSNDDALRVDLLMQSAIVHADQLGDAERAIELFFRILLISPIAEASLLAACRRVEPLLESSGRTEERLDVLERLAMLETDAEIRRKVLGTAAAIATNLGQNDRAIWAWEACLKSDGSDSEALDGLVELFERAQRWRSLIDVLRQRAATERPAEALRADRVRVARILSEQLGETDEAVDSWREVEAAFGETPESTQALGALLRSAKRWAELAQLLQRAAGQATTREEQAGVLCELGDVKREHLLAIDDAVDSYHAALEANPANAGARAGLRYLLPRVEHRAAAVAVLLRAYRATDEWRNILDLTEHRIATAESDASRVAILREAAELSETRAADAEAAFAYMRRAFLLDPEPPEASRDLHRLAEATKQWRSLAEAHREAIEAHESGVPIAWLSRVRFSLGNVLETKLDDPRAALNCYLRVAGDDPQDLDVARATVRVAGRISRWDAAGKVVVEACKAKGFVEPSLVQSMEDAAGPASAWDGATGAFSAAVAERQDLPPALARDLEALVALWHRDRRGDPESAETAFARALAHDPMNAELLAALAQLQRRAKGRPLVDSLLRLSNATGGDLDLLREAADIASSAISDRALAKSILDKLVKIGTDRWLGDEADTLVTSGTAAAPAGYVQWALQELVRIHTEEGDFERVVELLVEHAALPFPVETARAMRHDAARIAHDKLAHVEQAIDLYLALFEEDPDDAAAIEHLVRIYEGAGRRTDLLELTRKRIAAAKTTQRKVALLREAALLQENLGDDHGCAETLRQALSLDPREPMIVEELVRQLERGKQFEQLVALLADQATRAEAAGERSAAAEQWSRAAQVAQTKLGDADRAIDHFRRVIALEPRASALDALAGLSVSRGDFAGAADYLEHLRSLVEPAKRAETTLRLADALLSAGRGESARKRLEETIEAYPEAESVRARLAEIYRGKEEWAALAALLTHGANHAPDKATRLARLREAAELHRARTGTPAAAVPLLEQASDLEPDDRAIKLALADALGGCSRFEEARALLRALVDGFAGRRPKERAPVHYHLARLDLAAGDRARALLELDQATKIDPANPEILRTLAELARDDGQLERAERSYRALLAVVRRQDDAAGSPAVVRSEVLLELSAIAERQSEPDRAKEILESALEVASESELESKRLEAALRTRGDFTTLVRCIEARIAKMGSSPAAADAMADLADVLDTRLDRPSDALDARLRALAFVPESEPAHRAAMDLAKRRDALTRYIDQVAHLAGEAEDGGNVARACNLHLRVARIVEDELHDDRRAARIYERAREYGLHDDEILERLDAVYERLGDESAQARVLASRIEHARGAPGGDALYRLAELKFRSPETVDDACDLLVSAMEQSPDPARAGVVLGKAAAAHPKRERVLELYERIARAPGHEEALVDALTKRWSLLPSSVDPLREAVGLARNRGDAALAETLLRKFLTKGVTESAEDAAWAKAALAEIREGAGDKREAVTLKLEAADVAESEASRRLRFEAARLADELGDLVVAAATYERLHKLEPADRETWEPLVDVYRRGGNKQRLADLLAEVVDYVDDNSERSKLRLERVRIMMDDLGLGDAAAAPALREIVDDDPSQVEAAILLSGILERLGSEDELVGLLGKQLEAAKDRNEAAAVASLSLRLGGLLEKRDRTEAKNVYYAGLDWDAQNRPLLEALATLHRTDGDQTDCADALERILLLERGPEAEKLALELSTVRAELWDEPGAERALEYGFKAHPSSETLRDRLESAYRDKGAWDKLAALYEIDASGRKEVSERVAKLRDAAAIFRLELHDHVAAVRVLRSAHEAAPDDVESLADLVDVLAASGDAAGAVVELTASIERLGADSPSSAALLAQRAALLAKLGQDAAALDDFESAVAKSGDAYVKELCAHLEKMAIRAAGGGDTARWRSLRLRLAALLPRAGQSEQARELLSELIKNDPRDRDALRAQAMLEEHGEQWDAASATYRRLVALEEGDAVVETALRLADACEKAGRLADARGGLERARLTAPQDAALRQRLERIYEETGAFRELAELYLEEARGNGDVGGKFAQLLRAGSLFLDNGDAQAAIEPLKEAHALRTADLDCILRLIDAYTASGATADATELCTTTIASYKGRRSRELGHLHHRMSRIAQQNGDRQAELQSLTTALDMDSQNGVVASDLAYVAMELAAYEVATRALRTVTMLKVPAPLPKALAYQYLGEIARQQGDTKKAMLLLKRAIDDDPTLQSARALLDALQAEN